jgi:hypothetical protein
MLCIKEQLVAAGGLRLNHDTKGEPVAPAFV